MELKSTQIPLKTATVSIKFGKKKVSRHVLSVRPDLNKVKMSDIDLAGSPTTRYFGTKLKIHIKKVQVSTFMCLMKTSKQDYRKMLDQ